MKNLLSPTFVMRRDNKSANISYTLLAILVALAMFTAAAGAGPEEYAPQQPLPDWFNTLANIAAVAYGILVLIPRTRILGAILATVNMILSMYVNYTAGGVGFFVFAIPFNTATIMVASILIGHYLEDLPYVFKQRSESLTARVKGSG